MIYSKVIVRKLENNKNFSIIILENRGKKPWNSILMIMFWVRLARQNRGDSCTFWLVCDRIFAFKAYRNKDSKSGTSHHLLWPLVAMVLIGISNFQTDQDSNNPVSDLLHFIEVISEDLGVDKSEVYVNTSNATDGAILGGRKELYRLWAAGAG